jgi:hypothetical protein
MPIIRGNHSFDSEFTQIPNAWLRDSRLSLKAIGLLAQLLSHSPGWSVSIGQLAKANDCGSDLIRTAVKELEQAGYLERSQTRVATRFGEAIWRTIDPENSPSSGFPSSAFPVSENPIHKNNNIKNKKEKKLYDDWFDQFWAAYPRKVGKATARKVFLKLGEDGCHAVAGARRFANDPNLPPVQFIPHPTTWLNREGWLDEPLPPRERSVEDLAAERAEKASKERLASRRYLLEQEAIAQMAAPPPKCEHGENALLCFVCFAKSKVVENDSK